MSSNVDPAERRHHARRNRVLRGLAYLALVIASAYSLDAVRTEGIERRHSLAQAVRRIAIEECQRQNRSNAAIRAVLERQASHAPPAVAARLHRDAAAFAPVDCIRHVAAAVPSPTPQN